MSNNYDSYEDYETDRRCPSASSGGSNSNESASDFHNNGNGNSQYQCSMASQPMVMPNNFSQFPQQPMSPYHNPLAECQWRSYWQNSGNFYNHPEQPQSFNRNPRHMPRQWLQQVPHSNRQPQYGQPCHNNFSPDTHPNFFHGEQQLYSHAYPAPSSNQMYYPGISMDQRPNLHPMQNQNLKSKVKSENQSLTGKHQNSEASNQRQNLQQLSPKRKKVVSSTKTDNCPEVPAIKFEKRIIPCLSLSEDPNKSASPSWEGTTESLKIPELKRRGEPNSVKTYPVLANYFALALPEFFPELYHYAFVIERDLIGNNINYVMSKKLRISIMTVVLAKLRMENNASGIFSDNCNRIFSLKQLLNFDESGKLSLLIEGEELSGHEEEMGYRFSVTLSLANIEPGWECASNLVKTEDMLNVLLRCVILNKFTSRGLEVINLLNNSSLNGLVWEGIKASFNLTNGSGKFFLNIDVNKIPTYSNPNVIDVLMEYFGKKKRPERVTDVTTWTEEERRDASSILQNMRITYSVSPAGAKHCKAIQSLSSKSVEELLRDEEMSLQKYYLNENLKLKFPNGPALECKGRNQSKIPAELCTLKAGQAIQNISKPPVLNPTARFQGINAAFSELSREGKSLLEEFDINLPEKSRMHKINARKIAPPTLAYGPRKNDPFSEEIALIEPQQGEWDIWPIKEEDQFSLYDSGKVKSWAILNATDVTDEIIFKFAKEFVDKAATKNMLYPPPKIYRRISLSTSRDGDHESNVKSLEKELKTIKAELTSSSSFVLAIINKNGSPHYNQMKQAAELKVGILTQCVVKASLSNYGKILGNLLLKINSKLGHVNHLVLENPKFPGSFRLLDYPVMILGADVSHPPPGSRKIVNGKAISPPSYVGVTGSFNRTGMPYMMHVEAQKLEEKGSAEIIENLEEIVRKFILAFQNNSGMLPSKIIYFRDGVGDSQFKEVLEKEMMAIRKASGKWDNWKPHITFVAVQKRHKTRLFSPDPEKCGEVANPESGTVVDEDIVSSGTTDFYLISHKGPWGTSRPTRYQVLWDDSEFSLNEIETLAYYLCFMYSRCTKAVRIPAPTYYAHWAAKRAEALCQGWGHEHYAEADLAELNSKLRKREELDCAKEYPMHFI